jgi:hypothetical protein
MMKTKFWLRRKFFDSYGSRSNEQLAKLPPQGVRLSCPCCGYPTMFGATGEICDLCSWEGFEQDDDNAEAIIPGPNGKCSLIEARLNFEVYLRKYSPDDAHQSANSKRRKQIKQEMISAFERMMDEPSVEELNNLWQMVGECEQALYQTLKQEYYDSHPEIYGDLFKPTPCPYCGAVLRTSKARQCRTCGRDWHDPDTIAFLNL